MPSRHRKVRPRRKVAPLLMVTGLVTAMSPFYLALPALATGSIPSNFFPVVDTGGVNDVVGQGDLTQMGRDDTDASTYKLFWSWDETNWPGANTGDACALFDTDTNGNIDYAVCVEVEAGAGSTVVQSAGSPAAFTCDDSKDDRCAGSASAVNGATVGTLSTFAASPPADLVTDTDPFGTGDASPNDSTIQIQIPKASLPTGANLANVCSFPSIGKGGNDDPKDCVVNPGGGYLVIHKFAGRDRSTVFPFTINPGNISTSATGTGDTDTEFLAAGSSYSFTENVPSGWVFNDTSFCAKANQDTTGTLTTNGIKDITVEAGKTTNCYVQDDQETADLSLTKSASPMTFSSSGQTINYTITATNTTSSTVFFVTMKDPLLGGDLTNCTDAGGTSTPPPVDLAPAAKLICTGSYQTTAGDVTAGKVVNTATVHGNGGDDERTIVKTATATVNYVAPPPPPVGSPALDITKSSVPANGSTVHRGDPVTYTLSYGNSGTAAASGVVVSDTLPTDLSYVTGSASSGGVYDAATRTLTWQVGSLAAPSSGSVTFAAVVAQTATDGELLHNVGVLTAAGIDDPSNSDDLTVSVPSGDVTIHKAVDKDVAEFGDTLTYTVTVGATGNKNQTHVVATDNVPEGTSYVDGSVDCDGPCVVNEKDGVVSWYLGTLEPGSSQDLTFKVTIDTPTPDDNGGIPAEEITNVAHVTFDADPVETSNAVTTTVAAVLGEKAVRPPKVEPAQQDRLPFTGLPLLQLLTMATAGIGVGSFMVRRAQHRPVVVAAPLPIWRDQ